MFSKDCHNYLFLGEFNELSDKKTAIDEHISTIYPTKMKKNPQIEKS